MMPYQQVLDNVASLAKRLQSVPAEEWDEVIRGIVMEKLHEIRGALEQSLQAAAHQHDQLKTRVGQLETMYRIRSGEVQAFIPVATLARFAAPGGIADQTRDMLTAMQKYVAEAKGAADKIIKEAEEKRKGIGVEIFKTDFGELAKEHLSASKKWLTTASILLGTCVFMAYWFFNPFESPKHDQTQNGQPIQEQPISMTVHASVARVVFLSILLYATIWAGKMYRTNRHLYVVNKHRSLALSTFKDFADKAEDPATRSAVLQEATRCIFGPSASGYLGADEEMPQSRIVESVRQFTADK
jgi:hypothetical protein